MNESFNLSNVTSWNLRELFFVDASSAYILHAVYMLVCLWCIGANAAILFTLGRNPSLHSTANIFVANIACSDLALGLAHIVSLQLMKLTNATEAVSRVSCLVGGVFTMVFNALSLHGLLGATFERFIKICHPYNYARLVKKSTVLPVLAVTWIISFLHGFYIIINNQWQPGIKCEFTRYVNKFNIILSIPYPCFLVVALLYFNLRIIQTLRRHQKMIHIQEQVTATTNNDTEAKKNGKRAKLIGILLLFMFLAYIPFLLVVIIGLMIDTESDTYQSVASACIFFIFFNNVANPIIFGWKDQDIKVNLYKIFKCK